MKRIKGHAEGSGTSAASPRAALCVGLLSLALAATALFGATSAVAAEHPLVTGEYGKEGPASTGVGNGCRLGFQEASQRLYVFSDNKIYALERGGPGLVNPIAGNFPVAAIRSDCGDPDFEVDNSATGSNGRLYAIPSSPAEVSAWDTTGTPLASPWPVKVPGHESCGLAVTNSGEIWVGDYSEESVVKFGSDGTLLGEIPLGFSSCKLAVDPATKDLYAVNYNGGGVVKFTASSSYGVQEPFAPGGSGNTGISINGELGKVYVTSGGIVAYDTKTGDLIEAIETGGSATGGIAIDEATDTIFATVNTGSETVIKEWAGNKVPKATTGEPVGNTEVTGAADPNEAGDITECFFEFGLESPGYGSTQACEESLPITSPEAVHANLPGLFGEQTYHYRLVLGTGEPGIVGKGADKTITPHYVPSLQVEAPTEVTRTTVQLNASFEGNGEETEYFFEWGPTAGAYPNKTAAQTTGPVSGHQEIFGEATGLTAQTQYHYRVVASNGLGTSKTPDQTFTTALAVKDLATAPATEVNPTTAVLNGILDPDGIETTYYFQYGKAATYGQVVPLPPGTSVGTTTPGDRTVSFEATELEQGTLYHFRIIAINETGKTTATNDVTFETPAAPSVDSFTSSNVTASSAELKAVINPNGEDTTYYFEYGKSQSYGSTVPIPAGQLPAGETPVPVSVAIDHLTATPYHFRVVAESKWGKTVSADQSFTFYPPNCPNAHFRQQTGAGYLPDCRAYELVSPEYAGSTILSSRGPASSHATNPSRFAFTGAFGSIDGAGDPQSVISDVYVATRTNNGWVTKYTGIPGDAGTLTGGPPNITRGPEGVFGSYNLDEILDWDNGQQGFVCCGNVGSYAGYLWDGTSGASLGRVPTNTGEITDGFIDATKGGFFGDALPSPDFSHYFFSSNNVAFTADGLTTGPGSAYDDNLATGEVTKISLDSEDHDIPRDAGSPSEYIKFPGSSIDGSHVVMSTLATGGGTHLYMRTGGQTYDVTLGEDGLNHGGEYKGMTDNGKTVFFTTFSKLTSDDTDNSRDVYRWQEEPEPHVTLISQGTSETGNLENCGAAWTERCNADVVEIFGSTEFSGKNLKTTDNAVSAASGEIYFYSPELLDNGKGILGQRNFYVYREGQPRYITTFTGDNLVKRIQVAPNGEHMAFLTAQRLSTYDNNGKLEMYTYEPASRKLLCVSCVPDGALPQYNVEASELGSFLTDDGRAFFATKDGLVDRDANGRWDVYEYVESRPQLISSGTADQDEGREGHVGLAGVSADGGDVYFSTLETLVGQDRNGAFYKFYDARTNGGFEFAQPPTPCVAADECHGVSSTPPPAPTMATKEALGNGGNAKPVAKSKNGGKKHKKHKKSKKKHKRGTGKKGAKR